MIRLHNRGAVECLLPARIRLHFSLFSHLFSEGALLFIPFVNEETED